ncbi:hypothetical protein J5N97_023390 [Dioscorea zingiberensis]|uniref:Uncharacterized protein n=1 Tax=Dioscorea zingiberensis TaxID=325984 RepID=A0A9D5CC78_9LILI|nr:hypothetical protein J5N97_023390 [Dioscorea zingiberensis]
MRESDFSGCSFNGAYLEKAVAYKANFSGADLSDTLMDRMLNYLVPHRTTCKSSILRQKQKLNPIKCQNMWAEWNGKYHDDIRRFMKMILQYT